MRQIPINQVRSILKQLLKARNHQKVRLLTNKKDRSLTVIVNNGEVTVIEQGYVNDANIYSAEAVNTDLKLSEITGLNAVLYVVPCNLSCDMIYQKF